MYSTEICCTNKSFSSGCKQLLALRLNSAVHKAVLQRKVCTVCLLWEYQCCCLPGPAQHGGRSFGIKWHGDTNPPDMGHSMKTKEGSITHITVHGNSAWARVHDHIPGIYFFTVAAVSVPTRASCKTLRRRNRFHRNWILFGIYFDITQGKKKDYIRSLLKIAVSCIPTFPH